MAVGLADFILETANAPGTAAVVNLAGPPTGRRNFAAGFATGTNPFYFMDDGTQAEWGIGLLTWGSPNTLTRTTVLGNTAGNTSRLNFTGSTRVYNEVPAQQAVYLDATNSLSFGLQNILLLATGTVTIDSGAEFHLGYATDSFLDMGTGGVELFSHTRTDIGAGIGAPVTFSIGGAEAARFNVNGNFLFGCTVSDPIAANVNGLAMRPPSFSGGQPILMVNAVISEGIGIGTGVAGTGALIFYFQGTGVVGAVTLTSSGTTYATTSDYRRKTALEPLAGALERIAALPVYRFNWIGQEDAPKVDGMLAHEVAAIVPDAATGEKDAVGSDGAMIPQGVDYSGLVPILWAGVGELHARLAALEAAR